MSNISPSRLTRFVAVTLLGPRPETRHVSYGSCRLFSCDAGYRRLAPLFRLSTWRYSERRASKKGTRSADLANASGASTRVISRGEKLSRRPESRRLDAAAGCCEDDARPVVHGKPDMVRTDTPIGCAESHQYTANYWQDWFDT